MIGPDLDLPGRNILDAQEQCEHLGGHLVGQRGHQIDARCLADCGDMVAHDGADTVGIGRIALGIQEPLRLGPQATVDGGVGIDKRRLERETAVPQRRDDLGRERMHGGKRDRRRETVRIG